MCNVCTTAHNPIEFILKTSRTAAKIKRQCAKVYTTEIFSVELWFASRLERIGFKLYSYVAINSRRQASSRSQWEHANRQRHWGVHRSWENHHHHHQFSIASQFFAVKCVAVLTGTNQRTTIVSPEVRQIIKLRDGVHVTAQCVRHRSNRLTESNTKTKYAHGTIWLWCDDWYPLAGLQDVVYGQANLRMHRFAINGNSFANYSQSNAVESEWSVRECVEWMKAE